MPIIACGPFVDYAGFTVPTAEAPQLINDLTGWLQLSGARFSHETACTHRDIKCLYWGESAQHDITWFRLSGEGLRILREWGNVGHVAGCIAAVPHKITNLQIAVDVAEHAPRILNQLFRKLRRGGVHLTRKEVKKWKRVQSVCPATKEVTGTVYIGPRTADVWCKVYDKRAERLDKGFEDPGPTTRYELTVGRHCDLSLADFLEPAPCFWHFLSGSQGLLERPEGIADWVPQGSGYFVPPREAPDPVALAKRIILDSRDLYRLRQILQGSSDTVRRMIERKVLATVQRELMAS